jgi:hypothetical protein
MEIASSNFTNQGTEKLENKNDIDNKFKKGLEF